MIMERPKYPQPSYPHEDKQQHKAKEDSEGDGDWGRQGRAEDCGMLMAVAVHGALM